MVIVLMDVDQPNNLPTKRERRGLTPPFIDLDDGNDFLNILIASIWDGHARPPSNFACRVATLGESLGTR